MAIQTINNGESGSVVRNKINTNFTDAVDRTNHTGTQAAATISDFAEAARAQTESELVAGTNITITPSGTGATRQLTISSSGGGGTGGGSTNLAAVATPDTVTISSDTGTDATIVATDATNAGLMLPAEKTKLANISTGATANSTDSQLRDRATHTGAQPISSITGLQTAIDSKASAAQGQLADTAVQPADLAVVATSGLYSDLTGKPTLFSGAYNDLSGKPVLAAVATSGAYADLSGVPSTFAPSAHTHAISDVTGLQTSLDNKQPLSSVLTATTASFTTLQEAKLSGIATAATANSTDAQLRDRTTHTGEQAISSVTGLQLALDSKQVSLGYTAENTSNKNQPNGYVGLDAASKIAPAYLPSYVDDVTEVANFAALPTTGEAGKIYITLDNNRSFRWSGSVYVNISSGETNLSYTASPTQGIVVSDTGTDATIPAGSTTNASLMRPEDKTKLDGIAVSATANSSDATLLARANHTGTQLAATISDFSTATDARIAASNRVQSDITGITGADQITNMISLTQAEYDAIVTKNPSTFYVIV